MSYNILPHTHFNLLKSHWISVTHSHRLSGIFSRLLTYDQEVSRYCCRICFQFNMIYGKNVIVVQGPSSNAVITTCLTIQKKCWESKDKYVLVPTNYFYLTSFFHNTTNNISHSNSSYMSKRYERIITKIIERVKYYHVAAQLSYPFKNVYAFL